jgi:hypothetical protein
MIPDVPPQRSAKPMPTPASTIERAAQRLDWTIAFGPRHTPRGLEETTSQQPRRDPPRIARASWLRSRGAGEPRLLSISLLCLASVIIAAAAGTGIFLLTHSAGGKATGKSAVATEASGNASRTISLVRGLAMIPPVAGTAQSATLVGPAPTPATSEWEARLTLGPPLSPPGWTKPKVAATPAKSLEATSTFTSPTPQNQPVPPFSGA